MQSGFLHVKPESLGLSEKPLCELRDAIHHNVTKLGALPGCAHIVLKDGRCIFAHAEGWSDMEKRVKFDLDTLCPLHGATKPLVAAAFMTLVDEGKVSLSDRVDKYMHFTDSVAMGTKKAKTKPTLRHLLAMTGGVGYDDCPSYRATMSKIKKRTIIDLRGMCEALSNVPLQFEPGVRYHYGFSADLLGRICEIVSGERIDVFIKKRLLRPLHMHNTHFEQAVPAAKSKRIAVLATSKRIGGVRAPRFKLKRWNQNLSAPGIMSCGGGVLSYKDYGMVSSARDYARFCQMLLDGGRAPTRRGNGRQVLKEATVRSLWQDGLTPFQGRDGRLPGWNDADSPNQSSKYWDFLGWSLLNTHLVFKDGPRRSSPRKGSSMWMGGGGGAFWCADAERGLATVSFAPVFLGRHSEDDGFGPLCNDAAPFAVRAVEEGTKKPKRRAQAVEEGVQKPTKRRKRS